MAENSYAGAVMEHKTFNCVVRIRPVLSRDKDPVCIEFDDAKGDLIINASHGSREYTGFPVVLGPHSDQTEAFDRLNIPSLIDKVLDGFHGTILAYGQTGSGKTHTIMGGEKELDGIVPQAMNCLFEKIQQAQYEGWKIRASMIEVGNAPGVVNEVIHDLLDTKKDNLAIRYDNNKSPYIENLTFVDCEGPTDALMVLNAGLKMRRSASTQMNERSSRTHSVFALHVIIPGLNRFSKFQFIDLAGSERVKKSQTEGSTLKEAQMINKSLFTLAQVRLS